MIDRGEVFKRKKKASKQFREQFRHTPVSIEEKLPWNCKRLVVGTGKYGSLPVMDEVKREARRRKIDLIIVPTDEAIKAFARNPKDTNALLHVGRVLMRRQLRRAQVLSFTTARTPTEVSR